MFSGVIDKQHQAVMGYASANFPVLMQPAFYLLKVNK